MCASATDGARRITRIAVSIAGWQDRAMFAGIGHRDCAAVSGALPTGGGRRRPRRATVPSNRNGRAGNRLLEALPAATCAGSWTDAKRSSSRSPTCSIAPGSASAHVYFPTASFISLIMPVDEAASLEVGLVGDEGMFGAPLALGVDVSPVRAVVQGAGAACGWTRHRSCANSSAARRCSARSTAMSIVQLSQLAQTAALHALPRRRGAACPLAADDPGSRARERPSMSRRSSWP